MRRQFLLLLALTLASQLLETALEIGIPASVALHTEPGCFLYQQFGLSGTHVEDTITAVIGLLLVLVGKSTESIIFAVYGPYPAAQRR